MLKNKKEKKRSMGIIKSYDKGYLGYIPKQEELMNFIQFELPEIMHLYEEE